MLYGAYLGIREMDEYESKEYVLQELNIYINDYIKTYNLKLDFEKINSDIENQDLIRKLQDALIVLNMLNGHLDLILLIRSKLKELGA